MSKLPIPIVIIWITLIAVIGALICEIILLCTMYRRELANHVTYRKYLEEICGIDTDGEERVAELLKRRGLPVKGKR